MSATITQGVSRLRLYGLGETRVADVDEKLMLIEFVLLSEMRCIILWKKNFVLQELATSKDRIGLSSISSTVH